MASDVARKLFQEQERVPETLRAPVLPSARQQELHAITHQPFASWCPSCVLGRSRQSPHSSQRVEKKGDLSDTKPCIQIDYCYTFTSERGEGHLSESKSREDPNAEAEAPQPLVGDADEAENVQDYINQFGLNLAGAESTTGWVIAIPLMAKGTSSLKKVTEHITRLSMQVGGGDKVVVQGDPEPAVKQVINSIGACRVKLGLTTETRFAPRGSHASNGLAEKAADTVRRNALTFKAHVEDRIKAKIGGHCPIFAWLLRHAAFLHNRFFTTAKGAPPYEIVYGRQFKGKLIVLEEQCIFHKHSKYKGDVQWRRRIWVGVNERNGAHILLTDEGAFESRSIRRLPGEEQWCAESVLPSKRVALGLPGENEEEEAPLHFHQGSPLA